MQCRERLRDRNESVSSSPVLDRHNAEAHRGAGDADFSRISIWEESKADAADRT